MPSIRSLLTGITLTTFTLLQYGSATPLPPAADCIPGKTPTLPLNGGPTELPASSLTLAYVAIGRGVQNYTCTGAGAVPAALGAVATLYDATALAFRDSRVLHSIAPKAAYLPLPKKNFVFPQPIGSLPVIGHHYFDSAGTPVFDLSTASKKTVLFAAKTLGIKAPSTADPGPAKTGAVDWLLLDAKSTYTSVGLKQVYRVITAGGVGPTCSKAGVESVEYATEYWLYK